MFKMGCSMAKKILAIDGKQAPDQQGSSSSSKIKQSDKQQQQGDFATGSASGQHGTGAKRGTADELGDFSKLEDDPRIPLNVRQIFKITKSWKAIARTMSKTGTAMFLNLFEQNQDLLNLFQRFQHLKGRELNESTELRDHAAQVMSILDQSINSLSDYDNFVTYLHSIGKSHRKVPGFKRAHFWKIEQPFLKAVKQTLDERCNETIEGIYKIAIKLIIETIADGYGPDEEEDATEQRGAPSAGSPSAGPTLSENSDGGGGGGGAKRPASSGKPSSAGSNKSSNKPSPKGKTPDEGKKRSQGEGGEPKEGAPDERAAAVATLTKSCSDRRAPFIISTGGASKQAAKQDEKLSKESIEEVVGYKNDGKTDNNGCDCKLAHQITATSCSDLKYRACSSSAFSPSYTYSRLHSDSDSDSGFCCCSTLCSSSSSIDGKQEKGEGREAGGRAVLELKATLFVLRDLLGFLMSQERAGAASKAAKEPETSSFRGGKGDWRSHDELYSAAPSLLEEGANSDAPPVSPSRLKDNTEEAEKGGSGSLINHKGLTDFFSEDAQEEARRALDRPQQCSRLPCSVGNSGLPVISLVPGGQACTNAAVNSSDGESPSSDSSGSVVTAASRAGKEDEERKTARITAALREEGAERQEVEVGIEIGIGIGNEAALGASGNARKAGKPKAIANLPAAASSSTYLAPPKRHNNNNNYCTLSRLASLSNEHDEEDNYSHNPVCCSQDRSSDSGCAQGAGWHLIGEQQQQQQQQRVAARENGLARQDHSVYCLQKCTGQLRTSSQQDEQMRRKFEPVAARKKAPEQAYGDQTTDSTKVVEFPFSSAHLSVRSNLFSLGQDATQSFSLSAANELQSSSSSSNLLK